MRSRLLRAFIPAVVVAAIACDIAIYANGLTGPVIRSDGWSYYAYLPAILIFHDSTFKALAHDCCGGTFQTWMEIQSWPATGVWLDIHPMGVAILTTPFFLVAHALAWWSNLPRDGFSLYYQHAVNAAGCAYLAAGLWLLARVLARRFSDGVVLATLVCITWGTDLFHYGTFDASYSHVFGFCLCAALLDVAPRWFDEPTARRSIVLGTVAGLLVLVRHSHVLVVLAMTLYGVTGVADLRSRALWFLRHWRPAAITAGVAVAWCVPQMALYRQATGHWMANPYGPVSHFYLTSPRVFEVLFGVTKGLFFWSPVLLLALAGFVVIRRRAAGFGWPIAVFLPLHVWLVAAWWDWQFGSSFGHRAFADVLPLFALGLASMFDVVARTRAAAVVAVAAGLAVALSIAQMAQYWIGTLPQSDTTWALYRDTFLRFH